VPKIISECCELVKLCHINRSDPFFSDTVHFITSLHVLSKELYK